MVAYLSIKKLYRAEKLMVPLDKSTEAAERKLTLLYLIEKLNIKLSNLQIIKIVLENNLMNYFYLQHYINELTEKEMLSINTDQGKKLYSLTPSGSETLGYFRKRIPLSIRTKIDNAASDIRRNIRNETLLNADYITERENEFIVRLGIREDDFPLIDLKITVGTRKDAVNICENWRENSQSIYSQLLEHLISRNS